MNIKTELDALTSSDIYSLMLFALYKSSDLPEYSTLSQLSYILDKESLLKLCEYYGGLTIKIPTIGDFEKLLNALLVYQQVDIEHKPLQEVIMKFKNKNEHAENLERDYIQMKNLLANYKFNSGR